MNLSNHPACIGNKPIRIVSCSLLLGILFISNACKKDIAEINNNYQDSTLLISVKSNNLSVQELTYKDSGRIYELVEAYSYKKYSYDSQGKLVKLEQAFSIDPTRCFMPVGGAAEAGVNPREAKVTQYSSFEYDHSGKLSKKSNFYLNSETFTLTSYQIYEYTENLISKVELYNPLGTMTQYQSYTYDDKGNNERCDYYIFQNGSAKMIYSNLYEFDNKKNPFRVFAVEGIPGIFTNVNNIVKDTYVYYGSAGQNQHVTEYTYEYNSQGYPTKVNGQDYSYGK